MPAKFGDNLSLIILENLLKVLKLPDYIALQNTLLIKDFFNEDLPKSLNEHFKKLNDQNRHATRPSAYNSIFVPKVHTET